MGLREFFSRWSKAEDRRAIEREVETELTPNDRAADTEDFEGRKDDIAADSSWAGSAAEASADDPDS